MNVMRVVVGSITRDINESQQDQPDSAALQYRYWRFSMNEGLCSISCTNSDHRHVDQFNTGSNSFNPSILQSFNP